MEVKKNSIILAFEEQNNANLGESIEEKLDDVVRVELSQRLQEEIDEDEVEDGEEDVLEEEKDELVSFLDTFASGMERITIDNTEILVSPFAIKITGENLEETSEKIENILEEKNVEYNRRAEYARELGIEELYEFLQSEFGEFEADFVVGDEDESVNVTLTSEKIQIEGERELVSNE